MPTQHQMKDQRSVTLMAIIAERDMAVLQRNQALSEKKAAITERDQAFLSLNIAITDRNKAIAEREEAFRALETAMKNDTCSKSVQGCVPGCSEPRGMKHIHPHELQPLRPLLSDAPYDHEREMHISEAIPISILPEGAAKVRRQKRSKRDLLPDKIPSKARPKLPKKGKQSGGGMARGGDDLNKEVKFHWKNHSLGINQGTLVDATMPVPVCSCTGSIRQCYKWGNGGWQSSCCTTTLSMFPLPVAPNKRHSRVSGRKMSGNAFRKLLERLLTEGHDVSIPLDLRDRWARHGTNMYTTIR